MQALETEVAEPVSIENCGKKCFEVVYSVPSSPFEINFREKIVTGLALSWLQKLSMTQCKQPTTS